jgi:thiamine-monophosphate kinase
MVREELKLIEWFRGRSQATAGVIIGPGDDMAAVTASGGPVLIASDMILEGTHYDPATCTLEQVGHKALAACISDCAAMAVEPRFATVALALPRGRVFDTGRALLDGMLSTAARCACPVIGGDTTSWDGGVAIDVTVIATPWPGTAAVRRSGGRDGDLLCVSGTLGGSLAGHHLDFMPRVAEAYALLNTLGTERHALLDITDGLAIDTHRLATASGCGAILDRAGISAVASPAARRLATAQRDVVDHVLGDGEDFELLAAIDPGARDRLAGLACPWQVIGRLGDTGLWLEDEAGARTPLPAVGFSH